MHGSYLELASLPSQQFLKSCRAETFLQLLENLAQKYLHDSVKTPLIWFVCWRILIMTIILLFFMALGIDWALLGSSQGLLCSCPQPEGLFCPMTNTRDGETQTSGPHSWGSSGTFPFPRVLSSWTTPFLVYILLTKIE